MTFKTILKLLRNTAIGILCTYYGIVMCMDDNKKNTYLENNYSTYSGTISNVQEIDLQNSTNPIIMSDVRIVFNLNNELKFKSDKYRLFELNLSTQQSVNNGDKATVLAKKGVEKTDTIPTDIVELTLNGNKVLDIGKTLPEYKTMSGVKYFILSLGIFLLAMGVLVLWLEHKKSKNKTA